MLLLTSFVLPLRPRLGWPRACADGEVEARGAANRRPDPNRQRLQPHFSPSVRSMQLKQRRKKDKAPPDPSPAAAPSPGIDNAVVLKHARRLTLSTVVCSLPYVVQQGNLWLHLRSGLLRPGVPIHGLRQILIVGTQSAGTTQTSEWLQELGAEVGHETSDSVYEFARDGTVSWIHGLRFMPGEPSPESIYGLCLKQHESMGFHPAAFGPPASNCSYRSRSWETCWRRECFSIVLREWGCALRGVHVGGSTFPLWQSQLLTGVGEALGSSLCYLLSAAIAAQSTRLSAEEDVATGGRLFQLTAADFDAAAAAAERAAKATAMSE